MGRAKRSILADRARDEQLRSLEAAGLSRHQIADEMGLSMSAIDRRRYRLGLSGVRRWWPKERETEVVSRYRNGKSINEISKATGLTYECIYTKLRRLGIWEKGAPRRPPQYKNSPWTPEMCELVEGMFYDGVIISDIGQKVGLTKNTIIGWLDRMALKRRTYKTSIPTPNPFPEPGICLWPGDGENIVFDCPQHQHKWLDRTGQLVSSPYCKEHHKRAYWDVKLKIPGAPQESNVVKVA
jgi:hypothetical protein